MFKKHTFDKTSGVPVKGKMVVERRAAQRHSVSASAELKDMTTGISLAVRVEDISITGCFLDSSNTFPEGTRLRLHITRDGMEFNGDGTVRYQTSGIGMGLAFLHLDDTQKGMLQGWIEKLSPPNGLDVPDAPPGVQSQAAPLGIRHSQDYDALVTRLIEMLREKKLLSPSDVDALLRSDPLG